MKCFFKGMLGALTMLFAAAFVVPQYSDYRAASETSSWLNEIEPTKDAISAKILRLRTTSGAGLGIPRPIITRHTPSLIEVTDAGIIFLKGGRDGQVVVLIPSFSANQVSWHCIGGSSHATGSCEYWQ